MAEQTAVKTANLSQDDLNRIAEQVARILDLQKLDDLGAESALFVRSTRSGVCSTKSTACDIGGAATTLTQL